MQVYLWIYLSACRSTDLSIHPSATVCGFLSFCPCHYWSEKANETWETPKEDFQFPYRWAAKWGCKASELLSCASSLVNQPEGHGPVRPTFPPSTVFSHTRRCVENLFVASGPLGLLGDDHRSSAKLKGVRRCDRGHNSEGESTSSHSEFFSQPTLGAR